MRTAVVSLAIALAFSGSQAGHVWTFDELTARADLVVIASHISTQDTGERRTHPDLKPDVRAVEMRTEMKVLQVLKTGASAAVRAGATLALRHYVVIGQDAVHIGSPLRFGEPGRPYLLFLVRQPGGLYEPVSGQVFPTDSVYLLDRSDKLPFPLPPSLPNMSGTWLLINRSDAPADAARHVQVTQSERSFDVVASGGTVPASRTYTLGVSGGTVSSNGDRTVYSTLARDGSLVIETAHYVAAPGAPPDESIWRSEIWSVAGDRLTIHVKQQRADRAVLDAILVYRRTG